MVQAMRFHRFPDHGTAVIRALSSLTRRDADAVREIVRALGGAFGVQEHDDYDGYLSLLLTPAQETAPSFLVSGRVGAIDLAEFDDDDMTPLGTFASIGAAMLVLRPALERGRWTAPLRKPAGVAERLRARHGDDADHTAMHTDAERDRRNWSSVLRATDDLDSGSRQ